MRPWIAGLVLLLLAPHARAETPRSPYRLSWAFPALPLSAIEIDRGDLSPSRFGSDYELVKYLATLKKEKPKKAREGEAAVPGRELLVEELDGEGKVRETVRYVASLAVWRKRLGEDMVERLEDEFDAHLRMIFPHGPHGPVAPIDPDDKRPDAPATSGDKVKE